MLRSTSARRAASLYVLPAFANNFMLNLSQKLKDSGLADVFLGGRGITATVTIVNNQASSTKSQTSLFRVKTVNVKVDALKFSIRDSSHDLLYKTLRPLATGLIKKQVAKAMEDAIRTGFEYADRELGTFLPS